MDRALSYEHRSAGDQVEACRYTNASARLMSAFNDAALTLQRLPTGGNRTVTVQHVNVGLPEAAAVLRKAINSDDREYADLNHQYGALVPDDGVIVRRFEEMLRAEPIALAPPTRLEFE
jgi:hypothetical protein